MILKKYNILASNISGAGKGMFLEQGAQKGFIIGIPDRIDRAYTEDEVNAFEKGSLEYNSSVRWFEKYYSVSPEWSDECYINHSFNPNCLWHLGFIFALRDISCFEELTVDYRFLLQEGETLDFNDTVSGRPIIGFSWAEALYRASVALAELSGEKLKDHEKRNLGK